MWRQGGAFRSVGISEAVYYKWRKLYGGMGKSRLRDLKAMEKENARLKRIVAEFDAAKLILDRSGYFKPVDTLKVEPLIGTIHIDMRSPKDRERDKENACNPGEGI